MIVSELHGFTAAKRRIVEWDEGPLVVIAGGDVSGEDEGTYPLNDLRNAITHRGQAS